MDNQKIITERIALIGELAARRKMMLAFRDGKLAECERIATEVLPQACRLVDSLDIPIIKDIKCS